MRLADQIQRVVNEGPGGGDAGPALIGKRFHDHHGQRWIVTGWDAQGGSLTFTVEPVLTVHKLTVSNPVPIAANEHRFGGVIG